MSGVIYQGPWTADKLYKKCDGVHIDFRTFVAVEDNTGENPLNSTAWAELAESEHSIAFRERDCEPRLSPEGTHFIHKDDCPTAIRLGLPRESN